MVALRLRKLILERIDADKAGKLGFVENKAPQEGQSLLTGPFIVSHPHQIQHVLCVVLLTKAGHFLVQEAYLGLSCELHGLQPELDALLSGSLVCECSHGLDHENERVDGRDLVQVRWQLQLFLALPEVANEEVVDDALAVAAGHVKLGKLAIRDRHGLLDLRAIHRVVLFAFELVGHVELEGQLLGEQL